MRDHVHCDLQRTELQQGFATSEMGRIVILRGNDPQDRMSALGQKQTFSELCVMSALPPKADIGTQSRNVRFVPKADILRRIEERRSSIASPTAQLGCTGLC
jgi:hypothetical protein